MQTPTQVAHARLYPSLTNTSYLTLRSRRMIFSSWARLFADKSLTVLDVGGQYQPYRPLFAKNIHRYISVDLISTEFVTLLANAEALPFPPNTFDLVIATQVFEYFRDPVQTAKNIHAVLKPGGTFLGSFAACAPRFSRKERWRFTTLGLRQLFEPFATVEIVPELNTAESILRTVNIGTDAIVRHRLARGLHHVTLCPLLNLLGLVLQKLPLPPDDTFTTNFSVRAVKAT